MPLGDSITAGYTDNPNWQHPFNFGYRSGLVQRLRQTDIKFEMVGQSAEPFDNRFGDPTKPVIDPDEKHSTVIQAFQPTLDLRALKQNGHRGYGGWRIPQIEKHIKQWLQVDRPDIILLMIGINGISTNSPRQLDALVNTIFNTDNSLHVIVAQITPKHKFKQTLLDYNRYIRETLTPKYQQRGYSISTVDLYQHFLKNKAEPRSIDVSLLSNGINHPTNELYDKMAQTWFAEIQRILAK